MMLRARTVLVVDDCGPMVRLAALFLQARGFEVLTASSGEHAIAICRSHRGFIDAVVCDFVLPDIDGCDLAGALQQIRYRVPVVMISSRPVAEVEATCAGLPGPHRYVQKPFAPADLIAALDDVLPAASWTAPAATDRSMVPPRP